MRLNPCSRYNASDSKVRFWFSRDTGVPLRDQLATQMILAIASGELPAGTRLPSTRAIARRYGLHPNTVSSAYRYLEQEHWVRSVPGSGVFVETEHSLPKDRGSDGLDTLLAGFLETCRAAGFTGADLRERLDLWLAKKPRRFAFVDPDQDLREIVCHELRSALAWNVEHTPLRLSSLEPLLADCVFLARPSKQAELRAMLPTSAAVVCLRIRSVAPSLTRYLPLNETGLAFIASSWQAFLEISRTVLIASGVHPDAVLLRNSKDKDWMRGAEAVPAIVCDGRTAEAVPAHIHTIVFHLIAEDSIAALKSWERFYAG
jgi:DNA-binding transcriptional regulator YhcF (GntR family)